MKSLFLVQDFALFVFNIELFIAASEFTQTYFYLESVHNLTMDKQIVLRFVRFEPHPNPDPHNKQFYLSPKLWMKIVAVFKQSIK